MSTVDRTMSGQQQVTDEETRPGKPHNGASESKLNPTLLDRRRGQRWKTGAGERTECSEGRTELQNVRKRSSKWVKGAIKPVNVTPKSSP